jgi:hypothetical protein
MATTDIDGTPLFMLGADEALELMDVLKDRGHWTKIRTKRARWIAKLRKFLVDPQVIEYLETD